VEELKESIQTRQKALLVYNPKAGSNERVKNQLEYIRQALESRMDYQVEVVSSDCPKKAEGLFCGYSLHDINLVVIAGGDGTVSGVLEILAKLKSTVRVAIIPMGTGNLLARSLGIYPTKKRKSALHAVIDLYSANSHPYELIDYALNVLQTGIAIEIDMAQTNRGLMAIGVGAGPLAEALAGPTSEEKKRLGMLVYFGAMFKLMRHPSRRFVLRVDDEEPFVVDALGIFVSNLPDLGIGRTEKVAEVCDGQLDLFIFNCTGFFSFCAIWFNYLMWIINPFGRDDKPPYLVRHISKLHMIEMDDLQTPGPDEAEITVDGDPAGQGPLRVKSLPKSISIVIPGWLAYNLLRDRATRHLQESPS